MDSYTPFQKKLIQATSAMCRKLAEDELLHGFELCRLNYSSEALRAVASFESMPIDSRKSAALALTRLPQDRCASEHQIVEQFRKRMGSFPLYALQHLRHRNMAENVDTAARAVRLSEPEIFPLKQRPKLTKAEIKRLFLSELRANFTPQFKNEGASTCEAMVELGAKWGLRTFLDFGGYFQFRPSFLITHPNLKHQPGAIGPSLGWLLGVGEFGWDLVERDNLNHAAHCAVLLCQEVKKRFVEMAETIETKSD